MPYDPKLPGGVPPPRERLRTMAERAKSCAPHG